MGSKLLIVFLVFCVASAHCGLVSWFHEWSDSLNPEKFFRNRNKRGSEEIKLESLNSTQSEVKEKEEEIKQESSKIAENGHLQDCQEEEEGSNIASDKDSKVSLMDLEEQNNKNYTNEAKKHAKRCHPKYYVKMASPTSLENFNALGLKNPIVKAVRREVPKSKTECEKCKKNPICSIIKECTQCSQKCSNEPNSQDLGSSNPPLLSSRFTDLQDGDNSKILHPYANFSDGAEKAILCRILNIKNIKDIDTIFIYITTKSDNAPLSDKVNPVQDEPLPEPISSSTSPAIKARFGDDYDYNNEPNFLPKNISPSKSRKNPDVIEGPPPRIGDENPLIVEPPGLADDDDDNNEDKDIPDPAMSSRSNVPKLPGLSTLEQLTKQQEKHVSEINNALREAKEMLQNIQKQVKTPTLGSSNPEGTASNLNSVLDSTKLKEAIPLQMVDNLKNVNNYLLDRAHDALDMIKDNGDKLSQNNGAVGSTQDFNGQNTARDDHSEPRKHMIKDFTKMPRLVLNRFKDTKNRASQNDENSDPGIVSQTPNSLVPFIETKNKVLESQNSAIEPMSDKKGMFKTKLQKYLASLKKPELSSVKPISPATLSERSTASSLANRKNIKPNSTSQPTESPRIPDAVKASTTTKPEIWSNVEEKLKKQRNLFEEKLKKFQEEQKSKNEKPLAARKDEKLINIKEDEIKNKIKIPDSHIDTKSNNVENSLDEQKGVLKNRLNKFINGLKSGPIKDNLKTISQLDNDNKIIGSNLGSENNDQNNKQIAIPNSVNRNAEINKVPIKNLEHIIKDLHNKDSLEKLKKNTELLQEKLRKFVSTQNKQRDIISHGIEKSDPVRNSLPNENNVNTNNESNTDLKSKRIDVINQPEEQNDKTVGEPNPEFVKKAEEPKLASAFDLKPFKVLDKTGLVNDIKGNIDKLNSKLYTFNKIKPDDQIFAQKIREANDDTTRALKPKPTLPLKTIDFNNLAQKAKNDLKREQIAAKLREYVNGLHHKAPKHATPEHEAAQKYGKSLLEALKKSEKKFNDIEHSQLDPKLTLKNRLQKFMDNLKSETPKTNKGMKATDDITELESDLPLGETNQKSDSTDDNRVELANRARFEEEDTVIPYSNSLGKIVKSPNNELFFVGDGVKLPLRMATKPDGAIDLEVNLDKLCPKNCPKDPADIEQTVGAILKGEAELQKEFGKMENPSKSVMLHRKQKRSANTYENNKTNNTVSGENHNKIHKHQAKHTTEKYYLTESDGRKTSKYEHQINHKNNENFDLKNNFEKTANSFTSQIEKGKELLKRFNEKLNEDLGLNLNNLFYENELPQPLKDTANDLETRFEKEKAFIRKLNNKLQKEGKHFQSKLNEALDNAEENLINPYHNLQNKLESLNNEIEKEHERHDELLKTEHQWWRGDDDIDNAVQQEVSILEKLYSWYKDVTTDD